MFGGFGSFNDNGNSSSSSNNSFNPFINVNSNSNRNRYSNSNPQTFQFGSSSPSSSRVRDTTSTHPNYSTATSNSRGYDHFTYSYYDGQSFGESGIGTSLSSYGGFNIGTGIGTGNTFTSSSNRTNSDYTTSNGFVFDRPSSTFYTPTSQSSSFHFPSTTTTTQQQQSSNQSITETSNIVRTGTTHTPYSDTIIEDGIFNPDTLVFKSITAMSQYQSKSFEELRLEDYNNGNKGGAGRSGTDNKNSNNDASPAIFNAKIPTITMAELDEKYQCLGCLGYGGDIIGNGSGGGGNGSYNDNNNDDDDDDGSSCDSDDMNGTFSSNIFLVKKKSSNRKVVLKIIMGNNNGGKTDHDEHIQSFLREIKVFQSLESCEQIIYFRKWFYVQTTTTTKNISHNQKLFHNLSKVCIIEMMYANGGTLHSLIQSHYKTQKPFTQRKILWYTLQLCNVLSYSHQRGIAHNDIKSENILIDWSSGGKLLLTDFGTCVKPGEDIVGFSRRYASPELLRAYYGKDDRVYDDNGSSSRLNNNAKDLENADSKEVDSSENAKANENTNNTDEDGKSDYYSNIRPDKCDAFGLGCILFELLSHQALNDIELTLDDNDNAHDTNTTSDDNNVTLGEYIQKYNDLPKMKCEWLPPDYQPNESYWNGAAVCEFVELDNIVNNGDDNSTTAKASSSTITHPTTNDNNDNVSNEKNEIDDRQTSYRYSYAIYEILTCLLHPNPEERWTPSQLIEPFYKDANTPLCLPYTVAAEPRIPGEVVTIDNVQLGMFVQRGPHWEEGEEGGDTIIDGTIGVIVELDEDGGLYCNAIFPSSIPEICTFRIGAENKFELQFGPTSLPVPDAAGKVIANPLDPACKMRYNGLFCPVGDSEQTTDNEYTRNYSIGDKIHGDNIHWNFKIVCFYDKRPSTTYFVVPTIRVDIETKHTYIEEEPPFQCVGPRLPLSIPLSWDNDDHICSLHEVNDRKEKSQIFQFLRGSIKHEDIVSIQRIQAKNLWHEYTKKRERVSFQNWGVANEQRLFYKHILDDPESIISTFHDNLQVSYQLTNDFRNTQTSQSQRLGNHKLLIVKAVLGREMNQKASSSSSDAMNRQYLYHSDVSNRAVEVRDIQQMYPEYIIAYKQLTVPPRLKTDDSPATKSDSVQPTLTKKCVICWENIVSKVSLPCGHVSFCNECSTRDNVAKMQFTCPECRKKIQTIATIYV